MRALVGLLFLALAACAACAACGEREPESLPNIKLGMAPRDVRERFTPGGEGGWTTRLGGLGKDDDTILDWHASSAAATVEQASFEFHNGMLVALRATMRSSAPHAVETTKRTVSMRDGVQLTLLARDCPTHHEEAEALANTAR